MFKVPDKSTSEIHFRCVLRDVCPIAHFSSPSQHLEDMQYLKFGLVFDLNLFHNLDLYQVSKTLLRFHFYCFSYSPYLLTLSSLRK